MEELLRLLEKNSRLSNKDLANLLNEDEDAVCEKITQLEKEKIIAGYHTIINWDKTDTEISKAIIFVNCVPQREKGYDEIASRIAKYDEVIDLTLVSGKAEFMLQVKGKNMREISNFLARKLAPTEGVTGTETMFVLKEYKLDSMLLEKDGDDSERLIVTP